MAYFIDGVEYTKKEYESKLVEIKAHIAPIYSYVLKIQSGEITIEDVPKEYYEEVYNIINAPEPEEPEEPEQLYTLDEAAAIIVSEVAGNV